MRHASTRINRQLPARDVEREAGVDKYQTCRRGNHFLMRLQASHYYADNQIPSPTCLH